MPNLHSFVNLGTLNDGGEDSVIETAKKHRFLAAAILLFIGKIFITK